MALVIYTPLPIEMVLNQQEFLPDYQEMNVDGLDLQVEALGSGLGRITRIYSTDPQVYLDPRYLPGTIVYMGTGDKGSQPGFPVMP